MQHAYNGYNRCELRNSLELNNNPFQKVDKMQLSERGYYIVMRQRK